MVKGVSDFNSNGRLLKVVEINDSRCFLSTQIKSIPEAESTCMLCLIKASTNNIRGSLMKGSEPRSAGDVSVLNLEV